MKNLSRSLKIFLIVVLILIVGGTIVNAVEQISIAPSKTTVAPGGTFDIVVKAEDGCTDYELTFDCDKITSVPTVVSKVGETSEAGGALKIYKVQMVAQASKEVYKNGAELAKVRYTVPETLTQGDKITVTVSTEGVDKDGINFTSEKSVEILVGEEADIGAILTKIAVTKKPTKTAYKDGETFDKKGMEVTATYSDGTTKKVTGYTVSPSGKLGVNDKKVTITYKEGNVTETTTQAITVTSGSNTDKDNTGVNVTGNTNTGKDNTGANVSIPKTGAESFIVPLITIFSTTSVIGYVNYRKNNF